MGEAVLRLGGDVAALEPDVPGARRERAGDQVEEGALAGAVRPDDRGQAAGEEARGHVGERREAAEALGEPLDLEDRRGAHRLAQWVSEPQTPRGKNRIRSTNNVPTTSCQCTVTTVTTSCSRR